MLACSVVNCTNSSETSSSDIIYHRLPSNSKIRKQWMAMCDSNSLPTLLRICSEHFTDDDYEVFYKSDHTTFKRLKRNCVPHINVPISIDEIPNSPASTEENSNHSEEGERRHLRRHTQTLEKLNNEKFMENFNPETSARETRKVTRKVMNQMRYRGKLHDSQGIHISTGKDLCDCCEEHCPGCHFPCPKCKSQKCGPVCRTNRRWVYEQNEIEGTDIIFKHPAK